MRFTTCPLCGQEHSDAAVICADSTFDFLRSTKQANKKHTSLGPKTRCGLIAHFDSVIKEHGENNVPKQT